MDIRESVDLWQFDIYDRFMTDLYNQAWTALYHCHEWFLFYKQGDANHYEVIKVKLYILYWWLCYYSNQTCK